MKFKYKTHGTCSNTILFEIDDNKVHNVQFVGGLCDGIGVYIFDTACLFYCIGKFEGLEASTVTNNVDDVFHLTGVCC